MRCQFFNLLSPDWASLPLLARNTVQAFTPVFCRPVVGVSAWFQFTPNIQITRNIFDAQFCLSSIPTCLSMFGNLWRPRGQTGDHHSAINMRFASQTKVSGCHNNPRSAPASGYSGVYAFCVLCMLAFMLSVTDQRRFIKGSAFFEVSCDSKPGIIRCYDATKFDVCVAINYCVKNITNLQTRGWPGARVARQPPFDLG